jgi:HK97 family phage portal protein
MPLSTLITAPSNRTVVKSPEEAMTIAAFYSCINMISSTIAMMPRSWYYRDDSNTRKYTDYDQQKLIKQESRPGVIPYKVFRTWVANYLMGGNGYIILVRDKNFRPVEYQNRSWHEVLPIQDDDGYIWYYDRRRSVVYPYYNVLHLADLSDNEILGKSKVTQFAEMLGGQKGASNFVNAYFTKGLFLGAVIEYPESIDIDGDTATLLEKTMNDMYGSVDKSGQVGVITEGGKLKQLKTDIPLGDAQFIESQRLTREDIAMIFQVPITLLNSAESSYNTLEQTTTQYHEKAILPVLVQMEQEMNLKCLRPSERDTVYIEHEVNGILRADARTQADIFEKMIKSGIMTINEARHLKNMPPVEGGDTILVQANNMDTLENVIAGHHNPMRDEEEE